MFAHLCCVRNSNNAECPTLPARTEADWAACLVTHSETRAALDELIPKSSCGPDGVSARILHQARLVPAFIHAVSRLFSAILWQSGLPLLWLKVEITAIVKAQKDGKESKHYRPIGLSVNLCKALEWIVTKRTQPHLPTMPHQYGFTEHKSSEQVLTTITADITAALDTEFDQVGPGRSNSGRAMVLFVDAAAAYLSVNPNKFIQLLLDNNVPAYLIRFFHAFLSNRSQRVTWKGWRDEWRKTPWGGAQGLKSMSEIWKIFFADLIDKFPRLNAFFDPSHPQSQGRSRLKWACLADDLTLWATGRTYRECYDLLQQAAHVITAWSNDTGVEVSDKSSVMPFYPTTQRDLPTDMTLTIGGHALVCDDDTERRLLGLWFDPRMNYHFFVNLLVKRIRVFVNVFKFFKRMKLQFKRMLFIGAVISRVLFGAAAYWERLSVSDRDSIIGAVGEVARAVCGAMPGTASATAMSECGMDDLPTLMNKHIMRVVEKAFRLPEECQLRKMLMSNSPPLILKRFIFNRDENREPFLTPHSEPKWKPEDPKPPVNVFSQSFYGLRANAPAEYRRISNEQIVTYAAPDVLAIADGSVPHGLDTSAGAAVVWVNPSKELINALSFKCLNKDGTTSLTGGPFGKADRPTSIDDLLKSNLFRSFEPDYETACNTGPMASSFRPEAIALERLIRLIRVVITPLIAERKAKGITSRLRVLVLTDSMSNLDELNRGPHRQKAYRGACTWQAIKTLNVGEDCDLILAYVHSHCNHYPHDLVDDRAGKAAKRDPPLEPATSIWDKDAARERAKLLEKAPHTQHRKCFHDTIVTGRAKWRMTNNLPSTDQRFLVQMKTDAIHMLGQTHRVSKNVAKPCPWCKVEHGRRMEHMLTCNSLADGIKGYPRIAKALHRGPKGLVSHPCETALAFRVAIYLSKVPRNRWGRSDIFVDSVLKPFRDFCDAKEQEPRPSFSSSNLKPFTRKKNKLFKK